MQVMRIQNNPETLQPPVLEMQKSNSMLVVMKQTNSDLQELAGMLNPSTANRLNSWTKKMIS